MKKVMVCYDGSRSARESVEKVMAMFEKDKPEVMLLTVVEPPLDATSVDEESFEKWRGKRDADLNEAAEWVAGHGFTTDAVLAVGDPRKMIIEAAEQKSPDLLVVARRGAGLLDKMTLGRVSAYVIRHAHCPVAVI